MNEKIFFFSLIFYHFYPLEQLHPNNGHLFINVVSISFEFYVEIIIY